MACHVTLCPAHLPGRNQWQFLWRQGQQHGRQRWWEEGLSVLYRVCGVIFKHGKDEAMAGSRLLHLKEKSQDRMLEESWRKKGVLFQVSFLVSVRTPCAWPSVTTWPMTHVPWMHESPFAAIISEILHCRWCTHAISASLRPDIKLNSSLHLCFSVQMGVRPKTTPPWSVWLWWKTSLTSSMPCMWRWAPTLAGRPNMQARRRPTKRWVNPARHLQAAANLASTSVSLNTNKHYPLASAVSYISIPLAGLLLVVHHTKWDPNKKHT